MSSDTKTHITYRDKLKRYPGDSTWYFVLVPESLIPVGTKLGGWRSIRVSVMLGKTSWKTSIFYAKQLSGYLLFIKKSVRLAESAVLGDSICLGISLL